MGSRVHQNTSRFAKCVKRRRMQKCAKAAFFAHFFLQTPFFAMLLPIKMHLFLRETTPHNSRWPIFQPCPLRGRLFFILPAYQPLPQPNLIQGFYPISLAAQERIWDRELARSAFPNVQPRIRPALTIAHKQHGIPNICLFHSPNEFVVGVVGGNAAAKQIVWKKAGNWCKHINQQQRNLILFFWHLWETGNSLHGLLGKKSFPLPRRILRRKGLDSVFIFPFYCVLLSEGGK